MDVLYSLAFNLLLKLLLDTPAVQQPPPSPAVKTVMVEAQQPVRIPEWVTKNPRDSFVGISGFSGSIEEARQQALHSAIAQIVQNLGAEYNLSHESSLKGDALHAHHELKEHLAYTARWFVSSVNENIQETDIQETKGRYVCFVLVKYPPDKIEKLRKLTIGSKAGARIVSTSNDRIIVEVRENNGVEITFTEYEIELAMRNQHARVITMFFFKVPKVESESARGVLDRKITVKDNGKTLSVNSRAQAPNLKSMILGTERQARITLRGYDEIGRPITVPVQKF
jgi:hypothetical protein